VSSKDGSSGEHAVEVSSSILFDLVATLLLVIGGDGGTIERSDMDLVRSCTVEYCHSGAGGKRSTAVGLEAYKRGEEID
jgi:hypothetical protein